MKTKILKLLLLSGAVFCAGTLYTAMWKGPAVFKQAIGGIYTTADKAVKIAESKGSSLSSSDVNTLIAALPKSSTSFQASVSSNISTLDDQGMQQNLVVLQTRLLQLKNKVPSGDVQNALTKAITDFSQIFITTDPRSQQMIASNAATNPDIAKYAIASVTTLAQTDPKSPVIAQLTTVTTAATSGKMAAVLSAVNDDVKNTAAAAVSGVDRQEGKAQGITDATADFPEGKQPNFPNPRPDATRSVSYTEAYCLSYEKTYVQKMQAKADADAAAAAADAALQAAKAAADAKIAAFDQAQTDATAAGIADAIANVVRGTGKTPNPSTPTFIAYTTQAEKDEYSKVFGWAYSAIFGLVMDDIQKCTDAATNGLSIPVQTPGNAGYYQALQDAYNGTKDGKAAGTAGHPPIPPAPTLYYKKYMDAYKFVAQPAAAAGGGAGGGDAGAAAAAAQAQQQAAAAQAQALQKKIVTANAAGVADGMKFGQQQGKADGAKQPTQSPPPARDSIIVPPPYNASNDEKNAYLDGYLSDVGYPGEYTNAFNDAKAASDAKTAAAAQQQAAAAAAKQGAINDATFAGQAAGLLDGQTKGRADGEAKLATASAKPASDSITLPPAYNAASQEEKNAYKAGYLDEINGWPAGYVEMFGLIKNAALAKDAAAAAQAQAQAAAAAKAKTEADAKAQAAADAQDALMRAAPEDGKIAGEAAAGKLTTIAADAKAGTRNDTFTGLVPTPANYAADANAKNVYVDAYKTNYKMAYGKLYDAALKSSQDLASAQAAAAAKAAADAKQALITAAPGVGKTDGVIAAEAAPIKADVQASKKKMIHLLGLFEHLTNTLLILMQRKLMIRLS